MRYLEDWIKIVTGLPRVKIFIYDREKSDAEATDYTHLISNMNMKQFQQASDLIDSILQRVGSYVDEWLRYQTLWDLEPNDVFDKFGDDLENWCGIINQVKQARSVFDTSKTLEKFESLVIDYGNVQTKVNVQYDHWQREITHKFASKLSSAMRDFFAMIQSARMDLEQQSFNSAIAQTIDFVMSLQQLNASSDEWNNQLSIFQKGQKILEKQRYSFSSDWLFFDQVSGEWSAFQEILSRKLKLLDEKLAFIKERVIQENKTVSERINQLLVNWDTKKPTKGDISPEKALSIISSFSEKFAAEHQLYAGLKKAKLVLAIDFKTSDQIVVAMEELEDIKAVCEALNDIWSSLQSTKDIKWIADESWRVRNDLEELMKKLADMPNRMRQYRSFQRINDSVTVYLQKHIRYLALKSESLRDRHWTRILSLAGLDIQLSELTVGQVWDTPSFEKQEKLILEVVTLSQGEMALEEYLKQVKIVWTTYEFEFTNFQNKCRLIKGWDDLFSKSQDHLAALSAMKNSIYYKAFKEEAVALEDKLSRLFYLLDLWVNVQRQWVYLNGIFSGNAEIKLILPIESNRFVSIDAEFLQMLRKVYKTPLVMEVIAIPNILQTIQRLGDLFTGIQKSLGEYLEKERSAFARFYFLADEDLLEILGNSKDLTRIQPHLKKMFAATNRVILSESGNQITGISSKEDEKISFAEPIDLAENPSVNRWLQCISDRTKHTLKQKMIDSCQFKNGNYLTANVNITIAQEWLDVFPAQVILLTAQCNWTSAIETALNFSESLKSILANIASFIELLAKMVVQDMPVITRAKCEALITELVHQRDVTKSLIESQTNSSTDFNWLRNMRFYFKDGEVEVQMANATFAYGFEYLGIQDRLVQTPLTDKCFLTLCQALDNRLGGSPFGPAGTGKVS